MIEEHQLSPEYKEEKGETPFATFTKWSKEISKAEKYFEPYFKRCDKIIAKFKDDREEGNTTSRFNIFWSSFQTRKSMTFSKLAPVFVKRRINERDPVVRLAATTLEKAIEYNNDSYPLLQEFIQARDDVLLLARGVMWVRYVPEFEETIGVDGEPLKVIASEMVKAEYVNRKDYLHSPARTEQEITWKARRTFLTRDEVKNRFGEDIARKIELNNKPFKNDTEVEDNKQIVEQFSKATIWEIWDKISNKVIWISPGYREAPLDISEPPLKLKGFFPCPRPAYGTLTSDSTIPTPDYILCQDIANQLEEVTARISLITDTLAVRGVFDKSQESLQQLITTRAQNILIPADNWAALVQGGGLKGVIDFLPIDMLVVTLKALYEIKNTLKQDYYEISGDSDIMRGATNPNETATAQTIKSNYQNTRLTDQQNEMARLVRDTVSIIGEVIAEYFQPETIAEISGVSGLSPQEQQAFPMALQLLKDDIHRGYQIDIETDATIAPNDTQEKQNRIEFTSAITQFLTSALPIAAQVPMTAPLVGELLKFVTRGFKIGREMESIIDQTTQALGQMAQQAQQQQGQQDPKAQMAQMQAQAKMQGEQAKMQMAQQKQQVDAQLKLKELQDKYEIEIAKMQAEIELARQKAEADITLKQMQQSASEKLQIINAQNKNIV